MNRKIVLLALVLPVLSAVFSPGPARGQWADDPGKVTGRPDLQTPVPTGRIVFRFAADTGLVAGPDGVTVRAGAKASAGAEAARIIGLVRSLAAGAVVESRLPGAAAIRSGSADRILADLARYAQFDARTLDRDRLIKIAARLEADPAVDLAWLEPEAVPAALGFDAATDRFTAPLLVSANFDTLQGYLDDAPIGIGARTMRDQAGALGAGLSMVDVEGAWLWTHEDLPAPFYDSGNHIDDPGWRYHGTAVVGVVRGEDNGIGVTGITPSCAVGSASVGYYSVADAILTAAAQLSPGDVIVIELHAPGPEATGEGQIGYVPMEFWQDNFDAIRAVTAMGIIVCEAAGNGSVNLDRPIYQGLFDRTQRDSGAIMVGATSSSALYAAWFSNFGTRVDLNGWGGEVTTLAYGDLQGSPDFPETQYYTGLFNGTSSATPIVTGAVLGLQGMVRAQYGLSLDARLARDILLTTGTPLLSTNPIGTRPDLVAAWALAETSIGQVAGTVTDQVSGLPVEGVLVQVTGNGAWTLTAADGTWHLPLLAGPVDFDFSIFGYDDQAAGTVVATGATSILDVAMAPTPFISIKGTVHGDDVPVAGVVVTALRHPVAGDVSGGDGAFDLVVPRGHEYLLRFDGLPGYGARIVTVPTGTTDYLLNPNLPPIQEDFEISDGDFVAADSLWTWGTPPAGVVGTAFSGSECWGIGMDGAGYLDDQADTLASPVYDLAPQAGASSYQLSFHYWSQTETGFDGVQLLASSNSTDWEILTPLEGYTDAFLGGLGQSPGWSGHSGRWQGTVFDITGYAGGPFQFELVFGSDAGVTDAGFFVDGIAFGEGRNASPVPDVSAPAAAASLRAWPNPFNPRVNIAWEIPRAGDLAIEVFDLRGRRVRMLREGPVSERAGVVTWDGRDAGGRAAASGVYLVQLRTGDGHTAVQRVVLTK